jgi:hypothetical protein
MSILQYNKNLKIVAVHKTLVDASKVLNIPTRTISAATIKGSLCRGCWYFSREMGFKPPERIKGEKIGKKFTVTVSDKMWDSFLLACGQENKQNIFRKLLKNWIELKQ